MSQRSALAFLLCLSLVTGGLAVGMPLMPPAETGDSQAGMVPVNFTPQSAPETDEASGDGQLPNGRRVIPGFPPGYVPPAGSAAQAPEQARPSDHPVVQAPMPLLPEEPLSTVQEQEAQSLSPLTPAPAEEAMLDTESAQPASVSKKAPSKTVRQKPAKGQISKQATATQIPASGAARTSHRNRKTKPLVHFPADILPKADDTSRRIASIETGTPAWHPAPAKSYPRPYRPLRSALKPVELRQYDELLYHYNRGADYGQRNKIPEAIREFRQALRLNPDFADAYVGLSSAYMRADNWENAMKNAEKALELKRGFADPANITQARYNLAAAYCVAYDYNQAKYYYKQIRKAHHPLAESLWDYMQYNCKPD